MLWGAVNTSQYDQLNRVIATTDARGNTTTMEYDAIGNLLSLTDARNNTTTFTYDGLSRVKTRTDSNGKTEISHYDLNGNLIEFTDRRGQISTFNYDAFDRLVHEQYQDGSTVERLYDPRGQLLQAVDSSGGIFSFAYDLIGGLLQSIGPYGTVVYDRDALGRVSKRQVVGQGAVDYAYDSVGNLLSAVMPLAGITSSYDQRNQLVQQIRDNGVVTDYSYDIAGRLSNIKHFKGQVSLESLTYSRDARGNIIGKESNTPQTFTTQPSIFNVEDDSNRLVQRADISYAHDENGNRLTKSGASGITSYTWDSRNRLQSISTPDGLISSFRYDFAGNLIEQITQSQNTIDTKQYVLDDLTNVVLQDNINFEQFSILTGRSIDQHLATIQDNGKVEFALSDSINSTVLTIDEIGLPVGEFSYEPFGETISTGSNFSFQYTGRVPVSKDFYYYRARYYDPLAGQFVSEDPIGFSGGDINLFRYVTGNPVNIVDPLGLCPDCLNYDQQFSLDVFDCGIKVGVIVGGACLACLKLSAGTGIGYCTAACGIAITTGASLCIVRAGLKWARCRGQQQ